MGNPHINPPRLPGINNEIPPYIITMSQESLKVWLYLDRWRRRIDNNGLVFLFYYTKMYNVQSEAAN